MKTSGAAAWVSLPAASISDWKPAAETAAGDLLHRQPLRVQQRRVHQPEALIVGNQADPRSLRCEASARD